MRSSDSTLMLEAIPDQGALAVPGLKVVEMSYVGYVSAGRYVSVVNPRVGFALLVPDAVWV